MVLSRPMSKSDESMCQAFGTTLEDVERDVAEFENGTWEGFEFGKPVDGRPEAKMKTTSVKFFDFELSAIDRAAEREGITRSAFIRRACDNELVAGA